MYIFSTNSGDLTCSGLVPFVANDAILVHAHNPSPQLKSFLPNWTRCKFDKSQRKAPRGDSPEIIATTLSDVEVVTTLDAHGHIPARAMDQLKSKGVTMPFEFQSALLARAHPVTLRSSQNSPLRPSRRDAFAISTLQHQWITDCITTLGVPPTNDPFLDHTLLIHIMMNGKYSLPAGATMDANIKEIKRRVQGFQADCECRTNQFFRIQFLIMAFPDVRRLRSAPTSSRSLPRSPSSNDPPAHSQRAARRQVSPSISPATPIAASPPITARGQIMGDSHAPPPSGPAANMRSRGKMTPSTAHSPQPRMCSSPPNISAHSHTASLPHHHEMFLLNHLRIASRRREIGLRGQHSRELKPLLFPACSALLQSQYGATHLLLSIANSYSVPPLYSSPWWV